MNKPTQIRFEEFKQSLTKTINEAGLPAFLVELAMKDIYREVVIKANEDLKAEYEAYNNAESEA